MNFASWPFIGLFLPIVLIAFYLIRGERVALTRQWLVIGASLAFYGWAGWQDLSVFLLSIVVNFEIGAWLVGHRDAPKARRKTALWLGVAANIGLLLAFKIRLLEVATSTGFNAREQIYIPLAISFFTFQQIGFIASCYRKQIERLDPGIYLFFIAFFPHLVMGPILRFGDIDRQVREGALGKVKLDDLAVGFAIFVFGLAKKVLVADALAGETAQIFNAAQFQTLPAIDVWFAILAFQFQLFLDFSAYGDMAIGLGRMIGVRMPINFDRPHFARDRFELWRRWHISFVIFMRTNVFLPLVRHWKFPIPLALATTGMLSGLWHGLGWTFIVWGLVQTAIMLGAHYRNQIWRRTEQPGWMTVVRQVAMTFAITCLVGALFRAANADAAVNLFASLGNMSAGGGFAANFPAKAWMLFALSAAFVWLLPDTPQLFRKHWTAIDMRPDGKPQPIHWMERWLPPLFSARWAVATGIILVFCLLRLDEARRFVYVQF